MTHFDEELLLFIVLLHQHKLILILILLVNYYRSDIVWRFGHFRNSGGFWGDRRFRRALAACRKLDWRCFI
jgi:hypothetical protein